MIEHVRNGTISMYLSTNIKSIQKQVVSCNSSQYGDRLVTQGLSILDTGRKSGGLDIPSLAQ